MATKPIVQPELWASNAVYTTGPFIGSPGKVVPGAPVAAEGHRPGSAFPTPAEYENSQQNRITDLVRWVFLGSSAGAADAHIVETNAAGRATLHGLTVNDLVDETAVAVFSASAGLNPAMLVTCTAGAPVIGAAMGNASTTAFSTVTGTGATATGLGVIMIGTPSGGAGVRIQADAATVADGINITHLGTGYGARIFGSAGNTALEATAGTGQIAVDAVANATSLYAIRGIGGTLRAIYGVGTGGGRGGEFLAGPTGPDAVLATGSGTTGVGVYGRTAAAGALGAVGVLGEGRGTAAVGVKALSLSGPAMLLEGDPSSPMYPEVKFTGQAPDPTLALGGMYRSSLMSQLRHSADGIVFRSLLQLGGGNTSALLVKRSEPGTFVTPGAVGPPNWTTVYDTECVSAFGEGFYGVGPGAEIMVNITMDARITAAAAGVLNIDVQDMNAGGTSIFTRSGTGALVGAGYSFASATVLDWSRSVSISFRYAVPNDGDLLLRLRIGKATTTNIEVRDVSVTITGTWIP